jgi:dihydropyrimidine dehydrogenase (NAD+) subunit PreA
VKPIALNLVQQICSDAEVGIPLSGIGGVGSWRDCSRVYPARLRHLFKCAPQRCTTAFRIVEDMIDGLSNWMGRERLRPHRGLPRLSASRRSPNWKHLTLTKDRGAHQSAT